MVKSIPGYLALLVLPGGWHQILPSRTDSVTQAIDYSTQQDDHNVPKVCRTPSRCISTEMTSWTDFTVSLRKG
jgi:hypothetical protein